MSLEIKIEPLYQMVVWVPSDADSFMNFNRTYRGWNIITIVPDAKGGLWVQLKRPLP